MSKTVTIQKAKERQPKCETLKSVTFPPLQVAAVTFRDLKNASKTGKWDLFDKNRIRPIAEAFMANPSIPLTIIKDVREKDMDLAEDLLSMSSYANVAKAEFNLSSETDVVTYDLVIFELASDLHEATIKLVTKPINEFLSAMQWTSGEYELIHQIGSASSLDKKEPDESYSLKTPLRLNNDLLLIVEVAFCQTLEHVLKKVEDTWLKPNGSRSALVVKAYKYGDAKNNPAGLVPGLVMLWCRRGENGLLLVKQALFGTVPQADLRRLVEINGITGITASENEDITFQQQDDNWTISVRTDLFGFHEDQDYVKLFNKYAAASKSEFNPLRKRKMKRVCSMLKSQRYETEEALTFQIGLDDIWMNYQIIYEDWKDNLLRSGNATAAAAVEAAEAESEALIAAAAGVDNEGAAIETEIEVSTDEEE